jgi:hypothetical protein
MTLPWIIRYEYPGTVGTGSAARPVGEVYVRAVDREEDIWSYTRDPRDATGFTSSEAAALARTHHWPRARVVQRRTAAVIR